jgi:hypothetical protein
MASFSQLLGPSPLRSSRMHGTLRLMDILSQNPPKERSQRPKLVRLTFRQKKRSKRIRRSLELLAALSRLPRKSNTIFSFVTVVHRMDSDMDDRYSTVILCTSFVIVACVFTQHLVTFLYFIHVSHHDVSLRPPNE